MFISDYSSEERKDLRGYWCNADGKPGIVQVVVEIENQSLVGVFIPAEGRVAHYNADKVFIPTASERVWDKRGNRVTNLTP